MGKNPDSNSGVVQSIWGGVIVAVIVLAGVIYTAYTNYMIAWVPVWATQTAQAELTLLARTATPTTLPTWTPTILPTSTPVDLPTSAPTLSPTTTPTSTEDLRTIAFRSLPKDRTLSLSTNTALYPKAQDNNLGFATSDEYKFPFAGSIYYAQIFQRGIAYVKDGDWGNVRFTDKSASPIAREPAAAEAFKFSLGQYQIVINAESFLMKEAQVRNLGLPLSGEIEFLFHQEAYVAQQFAGTLICAKRNSTTDVIVFPR